MGVCFFSEDNDKRVKDNIMILGCNKKENAEKILIPNLLKSNESFVIVDEYNIACSVGPSLKDSGYMVFTLGADDVVGFSTMICNMSLVDDDDRRVAIFINPGDRSNYSGVEDTLLRIFTIFYEGGVFESKFGNIYFYLDNIMSYVNAWFYLRENIITAINDDIYVIVSVESASEINEIYQRKNDISWSEFFTYIVSLEFERKETIAFINGLLRDGINCSLVNNDVIVLKAEDDIYTYEIGDAIKCIKLSKIKQKRIKAGYSQKGLADLSCVPIKNIQSYEQNPDKVRKASVENILSIAKVLDCTIEDLLS